MTVQEAEIEIAASGMNLEDLDTRVAARLEGPFQITGDLPSLRETIWALVRDPAFRAFVLRLVKIAREEWERLREIIDDNGKSNG